MQVQILLTRFVSTRPRDSPQRPGHDSRGSNILDPWIEGPHRNVETIPHAPLHRPCAPVGSRDLEGQPRFLQKPTSERRAV